MDVPNDDWTIVVPTDNDKFIVQNRGDVDIAFTFSGSDVTTAISAATRDEYGVMQAGTGPLTITDIGTAGLDMYVRAYGPKDGLMYVS